MTDSKAHDSSSIPKTDASPSEPEVLQHYDQLKFELAGLIRNANSYASDQNDDQLQQKYQSLLTKLAEDRFYLTVVGQASRGKTTLINALLGMDRLPTGIVPITSVITSVSYGSKDLVRIYSRGWSYGLDVPLGELANYVTEQGNPGNKKGIELAEILVPAEILRRGFYLVDTPGFGSAIFENTLTTRSFLGQADAFIFVASFDAPFSSEELHFFREAQSRGRKVFVIVNKLDLVSPRQEEEVLNFLRQRLAGEYEAPKLEFFPVSARNALAAKLNQDSRQLKESRLLSFESSLTRFLADEKARQFLMQISEGLEELLGLHVHPHSQSSLADLHRLKSRITDKHRSPVEARNAGAAAPGQSFRVRPCSICAAILDASFDFLSKYQYELWRDIEEQKAHAERHGFCAFHTWQYGQIASPEGICGAYPSLLLSLSHQMKAASRESVALDSLRQATQQLLDVSQCRMCEIAAETERRTIAAFVSRLQRDPTYTKNAWTICLPHFARLLAETSDSDVGRSLANDLSRALEQAAENMQRYEVKHEGRRRELASEEEEQAAEVGLLLIAGHRRISPRESG